MAIDENAKTYSGDPKIGTYAQEIDNFLLTQIKNALAQTLSATIQELGWMPDACGDSVRQILAGSDECALLALGCYLDACCEPAVRGWGPLQDGLAAIRAGQAARRAGAARAAAEAADGDPSR